MDTTNVLNGHFEGPTSSDQERIVAEDIRGRDGAGHGIPRGRARRAVHHGSGCRSGVRSFDPLWSMVLLAGMCLMALLH